MVKIVAISLVCACIILYLRSINSELTLLASIGAGIVILTFIIEYVSDTFVFINKVAELSGIDKSLYSIIFKITSIGYLVEFGSSTLNDFGLNNLACKLEIVGKLAIFSIAIPIFYAILNVLSGILT